MIDLDTRVGCHACAVNCKEWNTGGHSAPLPDHDPYGADPNGVWFNRIHTFEAGEGMASRTVHFPRSCLHCEDAACVSVCPTGASYKREEDGIVLVNEDACIGCKLCSWACPYGAREYDTDAGVMKKCTLCIDRIYNENLAEEDRVPACVSTCPASARHFGDLNDPDSEVSQLVSERGGKELMPELGYKPVNRYLPPRAAKKEQGPSGVGASLPPLTDLAPDGDSRFLALGRPGPFEVVSLRHASRLFRHILHHRVGRRLRADLLDGAVRRAGRRAGGSVVRRRGTRSRRPSDYQRPLSSTAHLGHPERAARAYSQWKSSWLSREGVLATATYVPLVLTAWGWVIAESLDGKFAFIAAVLAMMCLLTVHSTGMIYATLRTISAWHNKLTVPGYLCFALLSGLPGFMRWRRSSAIRRQKSRWW